MVLTILMSVDMVGFFLTTIVHNHPYVHNLRHREILQAMLRKWPTPESCRPWLLAFYARKVGRDEWKR